MAEHSQSRSMDWKSCFSDLTNQLTDDDEIKLRFICGGFLSVSDLKSAESSLAIFRKIKEKSDNESVTVSRIREAMFHIRRYDVLRDILCSTYEEYENLKYSDFMFEPIRVLLLILYDELPDSEIHTLIFLFDVRCEGNTENGLNFLNSLIQRNLVSNQDVTSLKTNLSEMKRLDLVKKVEIFSRDLRLRTSCSDSLRGSSIPLPVLRSDKQKLKEHTYALGNGEIRGYCVIINNVKFDSSKERRGSNKDAERLKAVFSKMKYEVYVFNNLTLDNINETLSLFNTDFSHSDSDLFFLFVLSHGQKDCVLSTDEKMMKIVDMRDYFKPKNCPSLTGKPKLFFIQACQGEGKTFGVETVPPAIQHDSPGPSGDEELEEDGTITDECDFYTAIATVQNRVALRDPETGTWFIQTFCDVLEDYAGQLNFNDIMLRVNYNVGNLEGPKQQKQTPEGRSTLRFNVFLTLEAYKNA